jgi:glycosyltransferase involved in cell wall biosynthesis
MKSRIKLGYLVSHPIQYQAPLLRRINKEKDIELTVLYCSDLSVREYNDHEFGASFKWDIPLLEGYNHEFLPAIRNKNKLSFWNPLNYGLLRTLRKHKFDVIWLHGWSYWTNITAIVFAKLLGIKVFVRGESTLHIKQDNKIKQLIKNMFMFTLKTMADGFLAIGAWNREFYLHYGVDPKKIHLMPYAVDNEFFQSKNILAGAKKEELKSSLGLQKGRPIILYASKMTERKLAIDLLEAYSRFSEDGIKEPLPYLLFIGDGEMKNTLENRVEKFGWKSVKFLGFKNQTELPAYYNLCDVFVLPSWNEPWGLVINEVMNSAKAVIVSDQVGCGPDLVRNGENGYIFKAGNVEDLFSVLKKTLEDSDRLQKMGRKSLEIINTWGFKEDVKGLKQALYENLKDS